jgi:hypothetical protein
MRQFRSALSDWVSSPEWLWAFVLATGVCLLVYCVNAIFFEVNAGNVWGIVYGTLASLLMVGAALYAVRRRKQQLKAGRSSTWVQFHVYGGTLFMLLVFMHSGFRLPTGALNWWLWTLSVWVTVSGIVGVALQRWIPRILTSGLSVEAMYERIPEVVGQLRARAEKVVETCSDPVQDFYRRNVSAALAMPQPKLIYYFDITGGIQSRMKQFDYLRKVLSAEEKEKLDDLKSVYRTKLELDAHYTLQKALRWWLYTHVPVSLVLLVLVALHLYAVWYY